MNSHRNNSEAISRRVFLIRSGALATTAALTPALLNTTAAEASVAANPSRSDVGSLFPIIQSQAVKGEFPLSFINAKSRNVKSWKKKARAKLLELLHYSPEHCDPNAEIVERIDKGDFI